MTGIGQNSGIIPSPGGGEFPDGTLLTQEMGLLPEGYDISGKTALEVLTLAFADFVAPQFTAFAIGQSSVEVGTTISGNKNFSWTFDIPDNVADNSITVVDVSKDQELQSGLSKVSPASVGIGDIQKLVAGSHQWRGKALDNQGNEFQSAVTTVSWRWKRFWGFIDNQSPSDADIKAGSQELSTSRAKNWNTGEPAGEAYFFFAYPASFGDLSSLTLNGFPSLAAFTKTTRAFINAEGVSASYNIYVSNNLLNNTAPIITS